MNHDIDYQFDRHLKCIHQIRSDNNIQDQIMNSIEMMVQCYREKGKILFAGNGGSAADAEHLAAELSGKFNMDRNPLFAEALHVNSAALSAISNDYDFHTAYARILESKASKLDVLVAISTSGKSKNIIECINKAKTIGLNVIGISGQSTTPFKEICDIHIVIPSNDTARIQEASMLIGHILCQQVEQRIFS
ncbi:MAG: SIS domain-containing protein [Saprospiraceae bacterium]|nr:SIS domain-containing protein [Saprospiraceae bacterium]